ncbi:MAG: hypothetical protein ACXWZP_08500, partial [Gaiellaceae bacterium]
CRRAPTATAERGTVRPGESAAVAVLDPPVDAASGAADGSVLFAVPPALVTYDVLLLAGEPRRHTCTLPEGIEAGEDIEVAGERWTVADVRSGRDGISAALVCIYADNER